MESLRARCQVVTVVFVVILVLSAVAALSDLSLLQFLQGISSGEPVDDARAEGIDSRQAVIGILQGGSFLACAIVFLMWFHRAHKNLKVGGLDGLRYTPGWAVGGFFVPFLNLVRPFQVMKEVWAGSTYLSHPREEESWRAVSHAPHVGWWWALFLIMSFVGNASGRLMLRADSLEELLAAGWVTLASDLIDIPAAFVALFLVRRVTDLQERARTRLQTHE
ncbi:MAG: DUF4328 domain-containing protein [Thermoleophilia bacterium]